MNLNFCSSSEIRILIMQQFLCLDVQLRRRGPGGGETGLPIHQNCNTADWDNAVGMATSQRDARPWSPWFDCRWDQEITPFSQASKLVLGPTQPPIHWVPGAVSPGPKQRMREADHSWPSVVKVKNERRDTSNSPCLHVLQRDSFQFTFTKCVLLLLLTWSMFWCLVRCVVCCYYSIMMIMMMIITIGCFLLIFSVFSAKYVSSCSVRNVLTYIRASKIFHFKF